MKRIVAITLSLASLALAVYGGYRLGTRDHAGAMQDTASAAPSGDERKPLYWYDPMVPDQHFDKPGKSPFMDMELVPKYADEAGAGTVSIDPRMAQNLGIRTAKVERRSAGMRLDTVGSVEADEHRLYVIEARAAGWVEQLVVRAVGDPVKRGERVAGIYSPDLYAAQEELVLAVRTGNAGLVAASKQRLALLGLAQAQIDEVAKAQHAERHAWVVAPSDGVVTELNVRQGAQVSPGTALIRMADLSQVWIVAEIPEAQSASVHAGEAAEARLSALSGQVFKGKVDYVYPHLDAMTRTVKARLVFDNPRRALKPGMYAQVALQGDAAAGAHLTVPTEALIRTGSRSVVIVADGAGRFHPVKVEVGDDSSDRTVVLSGLEEGEEVVTSGQFLIDSEASLRGAFDRMDDRGKEQP